VRRLPLVFFAAALAACGRGADPDAATPPRRSEMPVAINGESPFQYPPELFDAGVEGEVRLRLFVDAMGRVVPESTRVSSSSGTPGLDSAALRGAAELRLAPGTRESGPVAMAFYQPVIFRRMTAGGVAP